MSLCTLFVFLRPQSHHSKNEQSGAQSLVALKVARRGKLCFEGWDGSKKKISHTVTNLEQDVTRSFRSTEFQIVRRNVTSLTIMNWHEIDGQSCTSSRKLIVEDVLFFLIHGM